jgi:hypothetical protein
MREDIKQNVETDSGTFKPRHPSGEDTMNRKAGDIGHQLEGNDEHVKPVPEKPSQRICGTAFFERREGRQ